MNLSELINRDYIHFQDYLYVKESVLTEKFKEKSIPKAKVKSYCNSYALLLVLRQFDHLKTYELFNLYLAVSDSNFSFQTRSLNHFYAKMKDMDKFGLVQSLLHKGISNLNALKLSEYHEKPVSHFYRKGSKLSQRDIYLKVNTILTSRNEPEISLSSVKRIPLSKHRKNLAIVANLRQEFNPKLKTQLRQFEYIF